MTPIDRRQFLHTPALLTGRMVAAPQRPNILLIVSEDNGLQLGCYGDRTVPTPHLDGLAAAGARWENAYVTQAVCSPSRASILTGLYPHQTGQIGLATHGFSMVRRVPTLPGLLKQSGYRTGLIGKLHVNPEEWFDFDFHWRDASAVSFEHRDVARTAEVAGEFFSGTGPFFLMVCFADAHLPFLRQHSGLPAKPVTAAEVKAFEAMGVDSPRLREHVADYYSCISRLDSGIGMLLRKLKESEREDQTLVAYLGDHGPQFSRGKTTCYEFALRVPLLMRWPGRIREGEVRRGLCSTIDLMPTLLEASNVPTPSHLPGRSLLPRGSERSALFCQWNTSHPAPAPSLLYPQRTVRDRRYKLISNLMAGQRNPTELYYTEQKLVATGANAAEIASAPAKVRAAYSVWRDPPALELYDLERDPHEFANLAGRRDMRAIENRLLASLRRWQRETADPLADPVRLAQLAQEDREAAAHPQGARRAGFRWRYPEYLYNVTTTER
ncbi:MAG: sulfatase [Bryobacterales bacterium]|nr:sulfatase [Bryobacterales bacterium]